MPEHPGTSAKLRVTAGGHDVTLTVVFIQEQDGRWSAQCLEHDIAAQARTRAELSCAIREAVAAHIAVCDEFGLEPFEMLPPAPLEYWQMADA